MVIFLIVTQLAAFALFLFIQSFRKRKELVFLSLCFLSLAVNTTGAFMYRHAPYFVANIPHLFYIGVPFAFLYAPMMFLYVKRSLSTGRGNCFVTATHFIPFIIFTLYLCLVFHFKDAAAKQDLLRGYAVLSDQSALGLTIILQMQVLVYMIFSGREMVLFRKSVKMKFSSEKKHDVSWLYRLYAGFLLLWLVDLLRMTGWIMGLDIRTISETALYSAFAVFCYFILVSALKRPGFFSTIEPAAKHDRRKTLSDRTTGEYLKRLNAIMEKGKPYLESELTLAGLSDIADIPARSLSEVIRSSGQDNFYDFVNTFRVREFLSLSRDPAMSGKTILDMMLEAGFNSKSAFNKAFKRKTGKSPKSFLKKY